MKRGQKTGQKIKFNSSLPCSENGIETPRLRATSLGDTPLIKRVLPDRILLSVIRRFRPPTRPSFFAATSPARVRSTSSSRSLRQAGHHVEEEAIGRGLSIDAVGEALKVHASMLKLAD